MAATVTSAKISMLERVVELVFVFFCYVEYEWSEACVLVGSVLFPCGCSSDGNYHAGACFADFYG